MAPTYQHPRQAIGPDEIILAAGAVLMAIGLFFVWWPAALIVPGALCVWLALPPRRRFVLDEPVPAKPERRA